MFLGSLWGVFCLLWLGIQEWEERGSTKGVQRPPAPSSLLASCSRVPGRLCEPGLSWSLRLPPSGGKPLAHPCPSCDHPSVLGWEQRGFLCFLTPTAPHALPPLRMTSVPVSEHADEICAVTRESPPLQPALPALGPASEMRARRGGSHTVTPHPNHHHRRDGAVSRGAAADSVHLAHA